VILKTLEWARGLHASLIAQIESHIAAGATGSEDLRRVTTYRQQLQQAENLIAALQAVEADQTEQSERPSDTARPRQFLDTTRNAGMVENFAEQLTREGVVVVRGALARDVVETFVDRIQPIYAAHDVAEVKPGVYGDGMLLIEDIPESILGPLRREIDQLVTAKFGGRPRTQASSLVRRVATKRGVDGGPVWSNHTGWHLDAEFFHCDDRFTANFWIPLSDGVNAHKTGVSFVKMSQQEAIELTGYVYDAENIARDGFGRTTRFKHYVVELFDQAVEKPELFTPTLDIGDVAVFSNWCPHASSTSDKFSGIRFSLEWRQSFDAFTVA
jgi:hypothetical protein